ncbi:MAG: hypothetical protein KGI06_04485 [Candidatus Micrarchaeota archaeon]|nr:hypothetical protein [Candidatus Micrarchaeota archaeon]
MATITALKREHEVSTKRKRHVDVDIRRAHENRSITIELFTMDGKSKRCDAYSMLAVGHYMAAARKYEEAALKALVSVEKDLLLIRRDNAYKNAGIMLLKLQRVFEGVGFLRESGMAESSISRLAHKYVITGPVLL